MRHTRGRVVQVEDLDDFDRRMAAGATALSGWQVRSVDLSERTADLERSRLVGASFVDCRFAPGEADRVAAAGALVLPRLPDAPVDAGRTALYTAEELYDATPYVASLDGRAYAWATQPETADRALTRALHDHAIDQALLAWARPRRVAGVMGGHAALRGDPTYTQAARLGRALGRTRAVATGGGPGAMEAANLGAWFAARPEADLDAAVLDLAAVASYRPSIDAWARSAFDVRATTAAAADSLAIPTWHYGHEPPNVFATAIAKYFRNATREAILLEVCDSGIVFLPGAGGTVQEVFQDACENYYADESALAPMVLVGRTHWTETLPVWPLLKALARGRPMEPHVHLVDTVEEAAAIVSR